MTPIAIPDDVRAAVYAHACAAFPAECCGYLCGPAAAPHVETAVACHNAQAAGEHPIVPARGEDSGFVIAGAELVAFVRSLAGEAPARVVYHSHPNGKAYFSAVDREVAAGPDGPMYPVQHLVVGVAATGVTEAALFGWSAAATEFVELARWTP